MSQREIFDEEEKERRERKARKLLSDFGNAIDVMWKTKRERILEIAKEFDKAGTFKGREKFICIEITKGLRPQIESGAVSIEQIYYALPLKYKLRRGGPGISRNSKIELAKDLPLMEVELIEKVAGLDFQDIRQMSISQFIQKYREIYLHTLQTMSNDEVHYQALLLDYLHPMTRDMLELTERTRSEMKKKSDMAGV
jgi:hypothetical protein